MFRKLLSDYSFVWMVAGNQLSQEKLYFTQIVEKLIACIYRLLEHSNFTHSQTDYRMPVWLRPPRHNQMDVGMSSMQAYKSIQTRRNYSSNNTGAQMKALTC